MAGTEETHHKCEIRGLEYLDEPNIIDFYISETDKTNTPSNIDDSNTEKQKFIDNNIKNYEKEYFEIIKEENKPFNKAIKEYLRVSKALEIHITAHKRSIGVIIVEKGSKIINIQIKT